MSLQFPSITIALNDAEVMATIIRLCARLSIPAYAANNIPVDYISVCYIMEQAGYITCHHHAGPPAMARHSLPLQLHMLRRSIEQSWQYYHQQCIFILSLGGQLQLDIGRRHIIHSASDMIMCELTEKETELLAHLHRCGEMGEDRETLLTQIWGYHPDVETRTVDSHLYRLRQKLAELPIGSNIEIISQQGRYRLDYSHTLPLNDNSSPIGA